MLPWIHSTRITGNLLEMQIRWPSSSFTEFRVPIIELLSRPGSSGAHCNLGPWVRFSFSNYKGKDGSVNYYTGAVNAD